MTGIQLVLAAPDSEVFATDLRAAGVDRFVAALTAGTAGPRGGHEALRALKVAVACELSLAERRPVRVDEVTAP
ncbi:hypothetical protein [Streptomyces fractus]|uniref:hypothetical protein n=1 Tax=Streptomyces fractus TaxID=641806 RepID=UPI003CFAF6FF